MGHKSIRPQPPNMAFNMAPFFECPVETVSLMVGLYVSLFAKTSFSVYLCTKQVARNNQTLQKYSVTYEDTTRNK